MKQHAYLRAYMAGIVVPTVLMLIVLTFFCVARFIYHVPFPIERILVFPMTLVPNAWGAWNMLYVRIHSRRPIPLGLHGSALVFLLAPAGFSLGRALGVFPLVPKTLIAIAFPIGLIAYYLLWKQVVGFFNELLGIA